VRLWDVTTKKQVQLLQGYANGVRYLAFSPDGTLALSSDRSSGVRLWDIKNEKQVPCCQGRYVDMQEVAFTSDGKRVMIAEYHVSVSHKCTVHCWDLASERELFQTLIETPYIINCVAFSPDGTLALTAGGNNGGIVGYDHSVRLWECEGKKELGPPIPVSLCTLRGHTNLVTCLAFSRDGQLALSGSADNTVRLWRLSKVSDSKRGSSAAKKTQLEYIVLSQTAEEWKDAKTVMSLEGKRILVFLATQLALNCSCK